MSERSSGFPGISSQGDENHDSPEFHAANMFVREGVGG